MEERREKQYRQRAQQAQRPWGGNALGEVFTIEADVAGVENWGVGAFDRQEMMLEVICGPRGPKKQGEGIKSNGDPLEGLKQELGSNELLKGCK